jgi:ABC-2 type transport system ATP-binding protein
MKKKLALSCSLVNDPSVLLLDEPTLGVDPVARREFWAMLSTLRAERGMSILVCTPYMDEAERCSWIGLMYKGKMIAVDTPAHTKAKVPGYLLEFHPSPDRFDEIVAHLPVMKGIFEVQTYGALVHVFVDDVVKRQADIEKYLKSQKIEWNGMRQIEPRMEEAFISLIHQQEQNSQEKVS